MPTVPHSQPILEWKWPTKIHRHCHQVEKLQSVPAG